MKIAVGFVHGIGNQKEDFYIGMATALEKRLAKICPEIQIVPEGIYWSDLNDTHENTFKYHLALYKLRWDKYAIL